jgi:DNA-directed RNA polymerase specialized sigma24 family protein
MFYESADILGISVSAVHRRIKRAQRKLVLQ